MFILLLFSYSNIKLNLLHNLSFWGLILPFIQFMFQDMKFQMLENPSNMSKTQKIISTKKELFSKKSLEQKYLNQSWLNYYIQKSQRRETNLRRIIAHLSCQQIIQFARKMNTIKCWFPKKSGNWNESKKNSLSILRCIAYAEIQKFHVRRTQKLTINMCYVV